MSDYRPFLVQKLTDGAEVRDSLDWNIYVKHVPFHVIGDLKEPYVNNWYDQQGEDVAYPDTPTYEAYDMECEFVYMGSKDTAQAMVVLFIKYLAENGMFKFYDTFTNIGRTNVRYKKQTEDLYYNEAENIATFKLTLRVTDPVTQVTLTETT